MSDALTREMLEWTKTADPLSGYLMRRAVQRIYTLQEQLAEKDRQIETWEIAAQKWVQQVDELCRKLDERAPAALDVKVTPLMGHKHTGRWWQRG